MTEVWIVQPYVPSYRVPFFEGLSAALSESGITLRVVAGSPDAVQAKRGDSITPPWLTQADDKVLRAFGRSVTLTRTRRHWRNADAVIVPHMGSSFDALSALIRKSGLKVGVWGHIASYTSDPNPVDQAIERWQLRRADHVFAYTPGGGEYARACGVADDRLTVVMNAVDTEQLVADAALLTEEDLRDFRAARGVPEARLFAYLGGLDSSKRIDFLAATLDDLHERGSDVHLAVGGSGSESGLLEAAESRGQVSMLGYVDGVSKAALLKSSIGIVNPGRVGLLAVDSLAVGRPILTTEWAYHAPEIEYLQGGESLLTSENSVSAFASLLDGYQPHTDLCLRTAPVPTLSGMIENFRRGLEKMLDG